MTDNKSASKRTALHRRNIDVQGYLRDDGLWEIEGILQDTKGYDINLIDRGLIPQGGYLHHMNLTLVIDSQLNIIDVRSTLFDTPYQDCPQVAKQYSALIGLQIKKGWIDDARQAVERITGCTHLTEMLPVLATAAMQTIRGYRLSFDPAYISGNEERTGMLNTCYGFRMGGRAQTQLWPDVINVKNRI